MLKRLFAELLLIAVCAAAAFFGGSACKAYAVTRDITYTFGMSGPVTGTVGSELSDQVYTISVNGGTSFVRPLPAGTDISSWFMGSETPLPAGIKVLAKEAVNVGDKSFKVEFKGKVWGASKDEIKIMPQNIYFDETESDWYAYASVNFGTTPKFNITRSITIPSGYSAVGNGLYVKDQKSGTAGWVLSGAKGTALTANNEMQVFIRGNFLVPMNAGYNISGWFTGELYKYNELFNASYGSVLPEGVIPKIKEDVHVGDSSFTIVFTGTPSKGSMDLIAFTIPANFVSYDRGSVTKGDYQDGCKVTVASGKYCYSISTDNSDELYTEFVKITYPEATLEAGKPVTEEDNLIATYEIIGTVNNAPIKFTDVRVNDNLRSLCYQNAANQIPALLWNDHITNATGLTGTIIEISQDLTTVKMRLTGTPKKQAGYPYVLGGRGFILNAGKNTAGHLITGYTSGDTTLTIVEPTLDSVTVNRDVTITKKEDEEQATVDAYYFTISLGDETLAEDLPEGRNLEVFYRYTRSERYDYEYNGIKLCLDEAAKAGDKKLKIRMWVSPQNMGTFKGYLNLSLPREYITRTSEYGYKSYYDIPFSRIYMDVEKTGGDWVTLDNEITIKGTYNNEYIYETREHEWYDQNNEYHKEMQTFGVGIKLNPIGTGKVQFSITLDPVMRLVKDFEAGESVLNGVKRFMWIEFEDDKECPTHTESRHDKDWIEIAIKRDFDKDFKFFDVVAAEPISAKNPDPTKPRTINLEIDLSKFYTTMPYDRDATLIIEAMRDNADWGYEYFRFENAIHFDISLPGSSGGASAEDSGIVYNREDVILYAKDAVGETVETTYLNLSTEKFATAMNYACYSTDGGTKWKAGKKLADKNIVSLLNKGMTLMIADKYDTKTKKPADDAAVYSFDEVGARPAAVKVKVDYAAYADDTGATAGQWALTDSSGTVLDSTELAKLEIGAADTTGKAVSESGYGSWPASGGLSVLPLTQEKVSTATYLVRVAPTADGTPASKPIKVKVKGQQKATKLKVNYNNEVLKLKNGTAVYYGGEIPYGSEIPERTGNETAYTDVAGGIFKPASAEAAKAGANLAAYITQERNKLLVWMLATAKKPATKPQEIELAARAAITAESLSVTGGKLKLNKKYEVYDESKQKWGGLPKVSSSCELKIRLKATAKGGKESDSTYAASETATLKITYGVVDAAKNKQGITAAEIVTANKEEDSL